MFRFKSKKEAIVAATDNQYNEFDAMVSSGKRFSKNALAYKGYLKMLTDKIQMKQVAHCFGVDNTDLELKMSNQNIPSYSDYLDALNANLPHDQYHDVREQNLFIELSKEPVITCVWNPSRVDDNIARIGSDVIIEWNKKPNKFEFKSDNHNVIHIYPLGVNLVTNGNHSILSGMMKHEGSVRISSILDISNVLNSLEYSSNPESTVTCIRESIATKEFYELAAIYELAKSYYGEDKEYINSSVKEYLNTVRK